MRKIQGFIKESKYFIILLLILVLVIAFSLNRSIESNYEQYYNFALSEAKESISKDVIYRKWAALEGGVYVPISEFTTPNPYLKVPNRDVETKEGLKLTLVNPAYMTRMVHGLQEQYSGLKGNITSLNPINPNNKPDKWEEEALIAFENNATDIHGLQKIEDNIFLRFISPFIVEESCLKCHADQGYKIGDVRGGISVSVPFNKYDNLIRMDNNKEIYFHLFTASFFFIIILFTAISNYSKNEKIKENQEKYRTLIEVSREAIFINHNNKIEYLNPTAIELLGAEHESQIIGKSPFEIFHPDFHETIRNRIKDMLEKNEAVPLIEEKIIRLDGTLVDVEDSATPFPYRGGQAIQVVLRDITARKITEEKLKTSQKIFTHSIDMLCIAGFDGYFKVLNPAWSKILGWSTQELLSRPWNDFVHPDDVNKTDNIKAVIVDGKEIFQFENRYVCKDGSIKWLSWNSFPYPEENIMFGVARDVTEKKATDNALRKSEEKFRSIVEGAPEPIFIQTNKKFAYLNPAALKLFRAQDSQQLVGKPILDQVHPDFHKGAAERIKSINVDKKSVRNTYQQKFLTLDNKEVWVETAGEPIIYNGENSALVFVRDITERKTHEEELKRKELERSSIIQTAMDGFWLVERSGKIIDANEAACRMLGYTRDEFLSMSIPDIKVVENPKDVKNHIEKIIENGDDRFESCHKCKNGEIIDVAMNVVWYRETERFYIFVRDITEQKRSINKLKASDRIFEHALDLFCIAGFDGYFKVLNPAWSRILGWSQEELLSRPWIEFVHPQDAKNSESIAETIIDGEKVFQFVNRYLCKDGSIKWLSWNSYPYPEENIMFGVARDVTQQRIEREQLKISEEKLKSIFRVAPIGIGVTINRVFVELNFRITEMTGYSKKELIGKSSQILYPTQDEYEYVGKKKYREIESKGTGIIETRWKKKNGEIIDIILASTPLQPDDLSNGVVFTALDITERKKVELEIRKSEERFRQLVLSTDDVIFTLDSEQRHTGVYGQWLEKLNLTPEFFIGKTAAQIYEVEQSEIHEYNNKLALSGKSVTYVWSITQNNEKKYFQTSLSPLKDNDGTIYGLVGVGRDITQMKKSQESLAEREALLKSIIESSPTAIFSIDLDGNILTWNETAEKMFGWTLDEVVGKKNPIVPYNKESEFIDLINKVFSGESFSGKELIRQRKDGSNIQIRLATAPIYGSADKVVGIMAVAEDITEFIKIERDLKEHDQRLRFALETSQIGAWDLDLVDHTAYRSIIHDNIFGYKELLPEWTYEMFLEHVIQEDREHVNEKFNYSVKNRKNWSFECRIKRTDGEIRWIWAAGRHYDINSETSNRMAGIVQDITSRKTSELELEKYRLHLEKLVEERTEELDQLNRDLLDQLKIKKKLEDQLHIALSKEKEINELKTRFVATVSHEFRTPLASLLSSAQMIQRYSSKWSEEKLNEHYNRISSTVNYLTQLLDDVLTVSRADRDLLINNPEEINLDELLNIFYEELKPSLSIDHKLIFSNNYKDKNLFIDKKLLRHIIMNLLTNAIKYSPSGGVVEMHIEVNNQVMSVEVSDNGLGIDPEEMKHIFDPFYRTKNSISIQGSGLGLNIARRAVEILGGKIYVESELNKGTKFFVRIPLNDKE